ncbi:hypothetical protein QQP08_000021 [Theobroma cacao]|nr:hypothetical protein QQP08_000021 [Theobroma cacao]
MSDPRAASNDEHSDSDDSMDATVAKTASFVVFQGSLSDLRFPASSSSSPRTHYHQVRELALDHVYSFNDVGMEALCSAQHLETSELVRCQEINDGFKTLVGSYKLNLLAVEDCPQISERAIHGAARSISFRQDLSWMY